MSGKQGARDQRRRNAVALVVSTLFHLFLLGMIINTMPPEYALPEQFPPPMDVRIEPMPPIVPPVIPPPKPQAAPKPQPAPPPTPTPTPPKPQPPKPAPAAPAPSKPEPQKPAPPKPTPPQPAPPKPSPLPAPVAPPKAAPTPTPSPKPAPKPTVAPTTAPPVPNPGPPRPAPPSITSRPSLLNLHKAAKEAPAGVPTLPMAPAGGPAGAPGSPAAGQPGQSQAGGVNGLPYGAMPSGGPGLRGTLVGCANADAVRLSSAERNHCNERFGMEVDRAPVLDPLSPTKRAAFDRAADRGEANRNYRASTLGGHVDPGGIAKGPASTLVLPGLSDQPDPK